MVRQAPGEPGFPDHTTYVDTVRRAQGVSSFSVEPGEDLRFFSRFFDDDSDEFPWAGDPIDPGERVFLRDISQLLTEDGDPNQPDRELGDEVSFTDPHIVPDGYNFEVVQDYVNMRGNVEVKMWGQKPSSTTSIDNLTEDDYEIIAPLYASGDGLLDVERVAEPTERSLFQPDFGGEEPIAITIENVSNIPEPIKGKVYIAVVQRDPSEA